MRCPKSSIRFGEPPIRLRLVPNDHSTLLARAMTVEGFRKTVLPDITQTSEGRSLDPFRIKRLLAHIFSSSRRTTSG